jgi:hypothetical protein
MPEPADPLISVRAGVAEPASMALPPGQAIGPLSFGRLGTWRVIAPGVLEEHGFLYFNGSALFLQSADPNTPVTVSGAPIPVDWTAVYAPCEIAFGGARLWFGPPVAPAQKPAPRPAPSVAPPRPETSTASRSFSPRVTGLSDDDESTRMHPIEEMTAARKPLPKDPPSATLKSVVQPPPGAFDFNTPPPGTLSFGAPPPAPSAPVMGPGPLFGPAMPFPAPPSFPVPPDAAPTKQESWIRARWREASGPKKAMVFLMLPLVWAVWVIFTDKPPAARPAKPAPSATASAPSASPSAGPSATPAAPPVAPPDPPASASPRASASASAAPASTTKTPQREAADAVAAGAFDRAARLYEELARTHPDVPAYAEAARIMKARAGKR